MGLLLSLLKWIVIAVSYLLLVEISKYVGLYAQLSDFIRSISGNEYLLMILAVLHGFLEALVFFNLYYPGTLVLIFMYAFVMDNNFSSALYVLSATIGVSGGLFLSNFIGVCMAKGGSQNRLISSARTAFEHHGIWWLLIACWNPNWISTALCGVGFLQRRVTAKYVWLCSVASFFIYYAYTFIFSFTYKTMPITENNHQYYVATLIILIGVCIELVTRLPSRNA